MNDNLNKLVNKANFSSYCGLDSIKTDCPWNQYEGLSPKEFIESNFSSLRAHTTIFDDIVSMACLDIVFIEEYSEKLKRKYWFCIYYFGNNRDGSPKYFVGGEPEKHVTLSPSMREKCNLNEYPDSLRIFWGIHGLFDIKLNYGKLDFNITYIKEKLSPEEGEGQVPHYSTLISTGEDVGIGEWLALEGGYISIDDLGNIDFDEEENFKSAFFIEEYLKKGMFFMEVGGDIVLLLQSYHKYPHFFYLCHDCGSNFYSSFWEYLSVDFSSLNA